MCTRQDALKFVVLNPDGYGSIKELKGEIGKDLFDQFCHLGYIREIRPTELNAEPALWERTDMADNDYKFYVPEFTRDKKDSFRYTRFLSKRRFMKSFRKREKSKMLQ